MARPKPNPKLERYAGMSKFEIVNECLLAASKIERLQEALARYGLHTWDCAWNDSKGELQCDCGWTTVCRDNPFGGR